MKNFKKVLALTLALAVIMSSMTVAFAASANDAKAKVLYDLGLFKGTSTTEFKADLDVAADAQTAIVLIGRALKWPVDMAKTTTFKDDATWAEPYIAYAVEKGITNGVSATEFGVKVVDGKRMVTWFLRALGYNSADAWTKNAELAATAKLTVPTATTRDAVVGLIYEGLMAVPTAAGSKSLITTIVGSDAALLKIAQDAGLIAKDLTLVKADAPNARQVVLTFSKAVDSSTVIADNVKVYVGTSSTVTTWTANVVDNVVTLGLSSDVPQDTDVKVVVANVADKTVATEKVKETTTTVRMKDVTVPSILSVSTTTSKTFVLTTSEPIAVSAGEQVFHVLQNITIDGLKLVAKITPDYAKNTLTVELGTKLSVGEHKLAVSSLKDVAGFSSAAFTGTITVLADTATPVIQSVTFVDKGTIKVTFDEPVMTLGTVTVDTVAITASSASADKKVYTLTLGANLGLASLVKSTISYNGTVDMEGNTITTAKTFDFVATDDIVVPTATVTMASNNKVKVVFSETISAVGTLTVKNSSGATVAAGQLVLDTNDTSNKTYLSANAVGTAAGTYTVELKDVKDNSVRANTMTTVSLSLTAFDIASPTVSQVVLKTAYAAGPPVVNGQATIYFSEAMDVATITNLSNYIVDLDGGAAGLAVQLSTVTGAAATASSDAKSVVLTIPGSTFAAGAAAANGVTNVYVLAVKDAAGNLIDTADFNAAKFVKSSAPALTESGFKLVATNKVKVTYTNALVSVDPSNFKVYKNDGTTLAFVGVGYELDSTSKIVTVTLNGNVTADGKTVAGDAGLAKLVIESGNTKDIFGTASVEAATLLVDEIAPSVATIATGAAAGEIAITFSEAVGGAAFTEALLAQDLIVKDKDGVVINIVGKVAYTLAGAGTTVNAATGFDKVVINTLTTGEAYTVELIARNLFDIAVTPVKVAAKASTSVTAK